MHCNNGFVLTGAGFDTVAELASPAAQMLGRYTHYNCPGESDLIHSLNVSY
jgi:hypothetical protein